MKFFWIMIFWNCAVFSRGPAVKDNSIPEIWTRPAAGSVFVILSEESFVNGKKGESDFNSVYFLDQIQRQNPKIIILKNPEKADLIIEIETEIKKDFNRIIPVLSFLTFTLIPFFQEIEFHERFRVFDKNRDTVFQSSRKQILDYRLGVFYVFSSMIQFSNPENINRSGFEVELLLKMNQEILEDWKSGNKKITP